MESEGANAAGEPPKSASSVAEPNAAIGRLLDPGLATPDSRKRRSTQTKAKYQPPKDFKHIKPQAAVEIVTKSAGSRSAAKTWIVDAVRDGHVKVCSKSFLVSHEEELSVALSTARGEARKDGKLFTVPMATIDGGCDWQCDTANWNWRRAEFTITLSSKTMKRAVFTGVRFRSDEIRTLQFYSKVENKKSSAGAKESENWENVWREVIRYLLSPTTRKKGLRSASSIAEHLTSGNKSIVHDINLKYDAVYKKMRKIYKQDIAPFV